MNAAPSPRSLDQLHLESMRGALKALLDQVPGSRRALPHLATLELSLARSGLESVRQASYSVLKKVHAQLASLPQLPRDPGLQSLQAVLLSAMARQRPAHPRAQFTTLGESGVVEVAEVSHRNFVAAAHGLPTQPDTFPDTLPYTPPAAP